MRAAYANCFGGRFGAVDLLLTDEVSVAAAHDGESLVCDALIDPDAAHHVSREAMARAFDWYLPGGADPTLVDGISAGDLAALEVAISVFMPLLRGILAGQAVRARGIAPEHLTCFVPAAGSGHHVRIEALAVCGFAAGLEVETVETVASADPRNGVLATKYARTRDPDWLAAPPARPSPAAVAAAVASLPGRLRPRDSLLVLEYNPTAGFAAEYARRRPRLRLVRAQLVAADLARSAARRDRVMIPRMPVLGPGAELPVPPSPIVVAQHDLSSWTTPLLGPLVARYGAFVRAAAPAMRAMLMRERVRAVLVPFDTPPWARLLVRVAEQLEIPTVVVNDGFKGDDIQREGFAADVALAWSESMARHYFSRRPDGATVVGRPAPPRSTAQRGEPEGPLRSVLVGGFTFSPLDLNCRRSDPERFAADTVGGIRRAVPGARITLKLHPADDPSHYAGLGDDVKLVAHGDVNALFGSADLYVTTYSTSLLDAVAAGVPVIYHRVNRQRVGPPFEGDPWLERRTSEDADGLTGLLGQPDILREAPPAGWLEHVLGPSRGATDRIAVTLEGLAG